MQMFLAIDIQLYGIYGQCNESATPGASESETSIDDGGTNFPLADLLCPPLRGSGPA